MPRRKKVTKIDETNMYQVSSGESDEESRVLESQIKEKSSIADKKSTRKRRVEEHQLLRERSHKMTHTEIFLARQNQSKRISRSAAAALRLNSDEDPSDVVTRTEGEVHERKKSDDSASSEPLNEGKRGDQNIASDENLKDDEERKGSTLKLHVEEFSSVNNRTAELPPLSPVCDGIENNIIEEIQDRSLSMKKRMVVLNEERRNYNETEEKTEASEITISIKAKKEKAVNKNSRCTRLEENKTDENDDRLDEEKHFEKGDSGPVSQEYLHPDESFDKTDCADKHRENDRRRNRNSRDDSSDSNASSEEDSNDNGSDDGNGSDSADHRKPRSTNRKNAKKMKHRSMDTQNMQKLEFSNTMINIKKVFSMDELSNLKTVPIQKLRCLDFLKPDKTESEIVGYRMKRCDKVCVVSGQTIEELEKISKNGKVNVYVMTMTDAYSSALTILVNKMKSNEYSTSEKLNHVRKAMQISDVELSYLSELNSKQLMTLFGSLDKTVYPYWLLKLCTLDEELFTIIRRTFGRLKSNGSRIGRLLPVLLKRNKDELQKCLNEFVSGEKDSLNDLLSTLKSIPVSSQSMLLSKHVPKEICDLFLAEHRDAENIELFAKAYQFHPNNEMSLKFLNKTYEKFNELDNTRVSGCTCLLGSKTIDDQEFDLITIVEDEGIRRSSWSTSLLLPTELFQHKDNYERRLAHLSICYYKENDILCQDDFKKLAVSKGATVSDFYSVDTFVSFVANICENVMVTENNELFEVIEGLLAPMMLKKRMKAGVGAVKPG